MTRRESDFLNRKNIPRFDLNIKNNDLKYNARFLFLRIRTFEPHSLTSMHTIQKVNLQYSTCSEKPSSDPNADGIVRVCLRSRRICPSHIGTEFRWRRGPASVTIFVSRSLQKWQGQTNFRKRQRQTNLCMAASRKADLKHNSFIKFFQL